MDIKSEFITFIHELQDDICNKLEELDGKAQFKEDIWQREEGGGGKTRVIKNGNIFEKGGVNTSIVQGILPATMSQQLNVNSEGTLFFACGISLVIHPLSPMIPTVHANYRYFELYDNQGVKVDCWFGGGADLTPYYLWEEDAVHFHTTHKKASEPFGKELYPEFKKHCDTYFRNTHRNNETRGVGGIFYDYLRPSEHTTAEDLLNLSKAHGKAFLNAYLPIVNKRKNEIYTTENKHWQGIRRGRYVEFNLIHDRGTLFGLRTNGRIESILMSLPPIVHWEYNFEPLPNSREAQLLDYLIPRNWAEMN